MKTCKYSLLFITVSAIFFLAVFAYFYFFSSYHLVYQEQTHLFLFNAGYLASFLEKPGGLALYAGSFLIQFCTDPIAAALITTLQCVALFLISVKILKKFNVSGVIWSFIPVLLLNALQSYHLYLPGTTIGLLLSLLYFLTYISVKSHKYRYLTGAAGIIVLYFTAGSFAYLAALLSIIHELSFSDSPGRFFAVPAYILLSFLIPVVSSKMIFYTNPGETWLPVMPFDLKRPLMPFLYCLLIYFPVMLISTRLWKAVRNTSFNSSWNWKTITAGLLVFALLTFLVIRFAYDKRTEILLRIDHHVQKQEWDRALEYSFLYPGSNQLVLFYGNLAMYKTGQMGDKMFHLPQTGISGLLLEWKRNEVTPFFGGEVFYHLGYTSEAYRWAFEAMVAIGLNPRSLKRLVITSLIKDETRIAQHYINILNETLFYREWARHYQELLDDPDLLAKDKEITEKRYFHMHTDILASLDGRDIGLLRMLQDHPDNRMAFEYYMASLLLTRDLDKFAENVYRLKDLGYTYIPVHYEEAMLAYLDHAKKNIVPAGYSISQETFIRLSGYVDIFNSSSNRNSAARSLYPNYGGTYWFYMNFTNIETP